MDTCISTINGCQLNYRWIVLGYQDPELKLDPVVFYNGLSRTEAELKLDEAENCFLSYELLCLEE